MIHSIAIDDEPLALDVLQKFCKGQNNLTLDRLFTNTDTALRYIKNHPVDLVFLDIQMPDISGLELVQKIPKETMIVFTTAYSEYAIEGYKLNVVDYLLKPFDKDRFNTTIKKIVEYQKHNRDAISEEKVLFVRSEYKLIPIRIHEIKYIEAVDDYVRIFYANSKNVMTLMRMKSMVEKLPNKLFLRVHKSYIINVTLINRVNGKNVIIEDKAIPIGNTFRKDVDAFISNRRL